MVQDVSGVGNERWYRRLQRQSLLRLPHPHRFMHVHPYPHSHPHHHPHLHPHPTLHQPPRHPTPPTPSTTGVLLRRLVGDPSLSGVSHVIVDEIHERGCTEDFLLIVLRDLLPKRPDLRVVLMSATLNSHLFCDYFHGCPRVEIPGFTHPVRDLFLEDILEVSLCFMCGVVVI